MEESYYYRECENDYQMKTKTDERRNISKTEKEKLLILDIQEKERQRIAAELHDSSLQNLTHLIHKLELCSLYMDKDKIAAKLELAEVSKELKQTINDIRNTIFNLRPMSFDDLGIQEAFQRLEVRMKEISDMKMTFCIGDLGIVDPLVLMMVFRLVNECVTNAVKHSQGKVLCVEVQRRDNHIHILVEDDGKGFDYEEVRKGINGHYGMLLLNERVLFLSGAMEIDSGINGTKVSIKIPMKD